MKTGFSSCQISNKKSHNKQSYQLTERHLTYKSIVGKTSLNYTYCSAFPNNEHKVIIGCGSYTIPSIHAQGHPAVFRASQPVSSSLPCEAKPFPFLNPPFNLIPIMKRTLQTHLSFWVLSVIFLFKTFLRTP